MKKLNNKGFTIVELVIVVAVIAILAAVLIPTISGLIKTAQTSADVTLVKNVNLILATERATEGKNVTMQDALDDALEGGYDVTKLSPTNSDNLILWDQDSDNFVLFANGKYNNAGAEVKVTDEYKLWNISDTTEGSKHSVYYTGTATEVDVDGVGFDAGTSSVETVNYKNTTGTAKDVLIRTNGGELVINASEDSVDHYGVANIVDVQAIANASYHEFGKATFIKVHTGRVVVESSAQIGGIHAVDNAAIIENGNGATLPVITADSGVTPTGVDSVITKSADEALLSASEKVAPEFSSNYEARIGMTGYVTYLEAYSAAKNGDTINVLKDLDLGTEPLFNSDNLQITIDLNGHTVVTAKGGTVTKAIQIDGTAKLNIKNGKIDTTKSLVFIVGDGQIVADNCEFITTSSYGIETNGSQTNEAASAMFTNCKITTTTGYSPIYISAKGSYTYTNCEIIGGSGVVIKSGNVTLDGCKITATGYYGLGGTQKDFYANYQTEYNSFVKDGVTYWNEKSGSTGDCVVIVDRAGSGYALASVEIKNCTFVVENSVDGKPTGYAVRFFDKNASDAATVTPVLENNKDANGNAIVTDSTVGGTYSFYSVDESRTFN